ncbi:MAG: DUF5610 domain-containing protein [Planctomycetota bacterium]|jgi:hypothetical protein|nr:DUF5610 domain-containing protein [Planctomycetota bacterium]
MINNDYNNSFINLFNNRQSTKADTAADLIKKVKARQDSIAGKPTAEGEAKSDKTADSNLSPEERRQKELKEIMAKIEADEAQRQSNLPAKSAVTTPEVQEGVTTPESQGLTGSLDKFGFPEFLNDMPLFNDFKKDLVAAFNSLDSATSGSINAQYELNYNSIQMIANANGGYDVTETSYAFKFDLNYVKAASGLDKNASLADIFGVEKEQPTGEDWMNSLKDYFSPEKTADRILDFSTSFFANSKSFKEKGDTEESRAEFAELMRGAIQKGFDQAMGKLGSNLPEKVQEGIDKTHELTFNGIDDFVKYGMNRNREDKNQQLFDSLQNYVSYSTSQTYSQKNYSLSAEDAAKLLQQGGAWSGLGALSDTTA